MGILADEMGLGKLFKLSLLFYVSHTKIFGDLF